MNKLKNLYGYMLGIISIYLLYISIKNMIIINSISIKDKEDIIKGLTNFSEGKKYLPLSLYDSNIINNLLIRNFIENYMDWPNFYKFRFSYTGSDLYNFLVIKEFLIFIEKTKILMETWDVTNSPIVTKKIEISYFIFSDYIFENQEIFCMKPLENIMRSKNPSSYFYLVFDIYCNEINLSIKNKIYLIDIFKKTDHEYLFYKKNSSDLIEIYIKKKIEIFHLEELLIEAFPLEEILNILLAKKEVSFFEFFLYKVFKEIVILKSVLSVSSSCAQFLFWFKFIMKKYGYVNTLLYLFHLMDKARNLK